MLQSYFEKKLLPAVTLSDTDSALSVAEAVLEGGLDIMEIPFRTTAAAEAVAAIAREFPEIKIGAGTILTPEQVSAAKNSGAQFGLAPGLNKNVLRAARELDFAFIPGVTTPSEIETALELGYKILKLFPASNFGGTAYIQSLQGPYNHTGLKFLPMGGINISNLKEYLEFEIVAAAGGSWMTPYKTITDRNFPEITKQIRKSIEIVEKTI